jgi:alpha-L-fucosidase 2
LLFSACAFTGCKLASPLEPRDGERIAKSSANELLWYRYPGQDWNSQALHLGNGYFGVSFFGGVQQEKFTLGEKTFWTGGPGDSTSNNYGVKPGGREHIQEIRRLIVAGRIAEADGLAWKYLLGDYSHFGALSTIGNLYLNFENQQGKVANYRRELDLHRAVGSVSYEISGVHYRREYFCSYPARALILRLTCDQPGALVFDVGIELAHKKRHPAVRISQARGTWEASGNIDDNNRPYRAVIKVLPEGGTVLSRGDCLRVEGASAVTVIYTAATDYRLQPPDYRGAAPEAITANVLKHLTGLSFQAIREEHIRDYQRLYLRTRFHLGGGLPDREALPTNERWQLYAERDFADLGFKELAFNFGKYLLISASRPGSVPAGIQGAWSAHYSAPWSGNYQININVPLIYMPGNALGLSECNEPFLDWIGALVVPGREVARNYFGTGGWVSMATGNIWGFASTGVDLEWGLFPSGAAWECRHLWEQYEFGQDQTYLRERAYPVMKEAAQFWLENLAEYHGALVAIPAVSAEQKSPRGFLLPPMQDVVFVGDLFDNVLRASEILRADPEFRARVAQARARLMPLKIGRLGQLQEWVEDVDDPNCKHRHFMHLAAVHPCQQINPHTQPALAEAARTSMNLRGDGDNATRLDPNYTHLACACTHCGMPADPYIGGNWSRAWKCWLWARLLDGDRADKIFSELIGEAGMENLCTYQQMPPKETPMQIDGSVTTPGFIVEMLVQSHNKEIELLPALPKSWASGSIRGVRARGGFGVDVEWREGKVVSYRVSSTEPRQVRLRLNGQARTITSARERDRELFF